MTFPVVESFRAMAFSFCATKSRALRCYVEVIDAALRD
jgi:hypothetical protein